MDGKTESGMHHIDFALPFPLTDMIKRTKLDIYFHVFVNKYVRHFDKNTFSPKR